MKRGLSGFAAALALSSSFALAETQTVTRSFGAAGNSRMCRIQVTREGNSNATNLNAGVTTTPSVHAAQRDSRTRSNVVQSLVVSSGYQATLDVDGESVKVRCLALPNSFELELTVASRPPLARVAADGPSKELSTTISVQRGQRLEIGGVTRDLRRKNSKVSTGGLAYGKAEEIGGERVYLVVQ